MPVAAFYAWEQLGRPLEPAQCIREFVEAMRALFPEAAAANQFSWYANDAHYEAVPAEDHTPYSQTGWPGVSPQWFVFATDIVNRPDLGVDIAVLGAYWLAEARAGRMPWLKYMNWDGHYYDVRNQWRQLPSGDDPGHIHLSARTDYVNIGLGGWSPAPVTDPPKPKGAPDMFRLIDLDGGQFIIMADPQAETGFAWLTYGASVDPQIRCLAEVIPTVDARTSGHNDWRPGAFGLPIAETRQKLIDDIAAKVVASLPAGQGGATLEQITAAVRSELDKTKVPSVPGTLGH